VTEKQQLHELVDQLPESETVAAARYLQFLITQEEAPVDPDMLKRIDAARAARGPGIPHQEILREFGACHANFVCAYSLRCHR
jgi:hypothetical protein